MPSQAPIRPYPLPTCHNFKSEIIQFFPLFWWFPLLAEDKQRNQSCFFSPCFSLLLLTLLHCWMNGWIGGGVNGEARARQSRKIYLERKRIFQDLVEVKQHFKDFEDFVRVKRAGTRQAECFVLFWKKCFRALLKVEQYFIHTRMWKKVSHICFPTILSDCIVN